MAVKTENLTILFVDIAGFTATTSRQSRAENAELLRTFEKTLLPIIKSYKGTVIKSIGDALLLTVRSPTDAMLCAMAMQDAMHEHNLSVAEPEKIHIRVAANLGEVRLAKSDIFGEPVNVAARIEGVTPADEIYLSEAVYMAMNKAEVPAQVVGDKELSGVSQTVRLYSIPRFATPRLVPETSEPNLDAELQYPYGGMHHQAPSGRQMSDFSVPSFKAKYMLYALSAVMFIAGAFAIALYFKPMQSATKPNPMEETLVQAAINDAKLAQTPSSDSPTSQDSILVPNIINETKQSSEAQPEQLATTTQQTNPQEAKALESKPEANIASSSQKSTLIDPQNKLTTNNASTKKNTTTANSQTSVNSSTPVKQKAVEPKKETPPDMTPAPWSIASAKAAYRDEKLTKAEYKVIVNQLEKEYDDKIRELKLKYRANEIDKATYNAEVQKAKRIYSGK